MLAELAIEAFYPADPRRRPAYRAAGMRRNQDRMRCACRWLTGLVAPTCHTVKLAMRISLKTEQERTRGLKVLLKMANRTVRITVYEGMEDTVVMIGG